MKPTIIKQAAPYTEFRITHKSKEAKAEYEANLDKALHQEGYSNRSEFIREKIRALIKDNDVLENLKEIK